jgi:hypothetical protein
VGLVLELEIKGNPAFSKVGNSAIAQPELLGPATNRISLFAENFWAKITA